MFKSIFKSFSFHESKEDGKDDEAEGYEVVPADGLAFEDGGYNDGEHYERDALLYDLELHEGEGSSGDLGADAVGRNHKGVFEEGHAPREDNNAYQRPVFDEVHLLQFEVAVPSKRHEDVGADEHEYSD